jgi:hypothetical protein
VSALALDSDPFEPVPEPGAGAESGPFHDYTCSPSNLPHLGIDPSVRDWLLDQIGAPVNG